MNLTAAIEVLQRLSGQVPEVPGTVTLVGSRLILDNPDARGALSVAMMLQLAAAVQELQTTPLPWVRLQSVGPACFCSGGHLVQVRGALGTPDAGLAMSEAMTVVLDSLSRAPCLVIAEIDGPALGGGAELLTACDLVLAGPGARIGFVHAGLGVTTGWGGAQRLARRVGPAVALRLLALGPVLKPAAAFEQGLVDAHGEDLEVLVQTTLARLSRASPGALRGFKRILGTPDRTGLESAVFGSLWGGADHVTRVAAATQGRDEPG